jgi:hypothetical protein
MACNVCEGHTRGTYHHDTCTCLSCNRSTTVCEGRTEASSDMMCASACYLYVILRARLCGLLSICARVCVRESSLRSARLVFVLTGSAAAIGVRPRSG